MGKTFKEFIGGVKFGNVNVGQTTARLGVQIGRGVCGVNQADELFCDRRLTGKVVLGLVDEAANQKQLLDVDHEVSGVFDVTGFRVTSDTIGLGLTFKLKEIDIAELAKFSAKEGRLVITEVEKIPEDEEGDEDETDDAHIPGTLKADGPWRDFSLDALFDPKKAVRKKLAAANINTVGQLADYTATGDKRLTDVDGIGEGKAQEIEDRMLEFYGDNPELAEMAEAK